MKTNFSLGQVFGYWTVVGEADYILTKGGNKVYRQPVRCVCGTEKVIPRESLIRGRSKSCGCNRFKTIPIGQKFGRWTITGPRFINSSGEKRFAEYPVRCECGKERLVAGYNLKSENSNSCGCLIGESAVKRFTKGQGVSTQNTILRGYKRGAKKRGHEWSISDQFAIALMESRCRYCGDPGSTVSRRTWGAGRAGASWTRNGIDRLDNSIGYTESNSVSCCWWCNLAKNQRSEQDFLEWANKIVANSAGAML